MNSRAALPQPLFNASDQEYQDALSVQSYAELMRLEREVMQNWSEYQDDKQFDLLRRPVWKGVILALYISVILIGMIGNAIVVYVVVRNKNMQNVTNIFIANLALSDIGLCVYSLPVQLYYQLTDKWIFGEVLCRLLFAAFAVPMYVSTLAILLIALDRYWLIVYPLRERMSVKTALIFILVSAIVSILLAIPVMALSTTHYIEEPDINLYRAYCIEKWPNPIGRKAYSLLMFLLQFCLPLVMTALLYFKIYTRLKFRPTQCQHNQERKQKTNKILVAIVTVFIICWLPWNLFSLITELDHSLVSGIHFKFVDLLLKVFAMGSACVNPFLYCWLNDNFRKELDTMAIKLHIIRQPAAPWRRHQGLQYHLQAPTVDDNGINVTDNGCNGITIDRLSTANTTMERTSTGNIYGPNTLLSVN